MRGRLLRRFPLGLAYSLLTLLTVVLLVHGDDIGLSESLENVLTRLMLLWPFALFADVGWSLRCERDERSNRLGLGVIVVLLLVGYFLLPHRPQHEAASFWFRYFLSLAAMLVAAAGGAARRAGTPDLWDSAWPVVLAAFMATLSAMLVVGGVCLALVSVEKLFAVSIPEEVYWDMFFAGFFVLGPVTAFAWLPYPYGATQRQPGWLKSTARMVLTPLGLLYALILFIYVGKIALAARWPDGWVAMPTLIFGTLGLAAYLIARPARDRDGERWADRLVRLFPWVLLPLAVVLLMAMRVRIVSYGFTEWRVIGLALGGWLLLFAAVYAVRNRWSPWWIAASLAAVGVALSIGPLSAPSISLHSQRARLDRLLTDAGAYNEDPVTVEGDAAKRIQSGVQYLLGHHGAEGLPDRVQDQWNVWRAENDEEPLENETRRYGRYRYREVLEALNVTLQHDDRAGWYRVRAAMESVPLAAYQHLTFGVVGETNRFPFRIDNELHVKAGDVELAVPERAALVEGIIEAVQGKPAGEVQVPVELLSLRLFHAGEQYLVVLPEVTVQLNQRDSTAPALRSYGGRYVVLHHRPLLKNVSVE